MRKNLRILRPLLFVILIGGILSTGCTGPKAPPQEKSDLPADYFPTTKGYSWEFKGYGNEYASFTRKVLYAKDGLAQLQDSNGGTVMAVVFRITPEAVTRVFSKGEAYDETNYLNAAPIENTVILKAPLKKGTKWQDQNGTREITAVDASVPTPAGLYNKCLEVTITGENSVIHEYYQKGMGLVKKEFISGDAKVTSTLEKTTCPGN